MKRTIILLIAVFSLTASAKKAVKDSGTSFAREVLQPYVESGRLAGAISVFYKDGVQETCCIGYADVAARRPIRMDNVFMQCSQTKGFCGVTIAKLVEEGRLSLDDPVSKYLPELGTGRRERRYQDPPSRQERAHRAYGAQPHWRFPLRVQRQA